MTSDQSRIASLLTELDRAGAAEVTAFLRNHDDVDATIEQLCEHVERLVIADLDQALRVSERLVEAAVSIQSNAAARALRTRAHVLAWVNRFDDALRVAEEAIQRSWRCGNEIEAARAHLTRLHALARLGSFSEAIAAGVKAIAVFEKHGDSTLLGKASANLGVVHRMRDDPAAALACFERAAGMLQGQPPATLAQLQSNRAEALMDLHRFDEAEHAFREALSRFEEVGAHRAAAIVHGNIADLLTRQGRIDRSLEHFESAAQHFESAGAASGDLARLRAEHGEAFALAGAWNEATEMYRRALPTLDESGLVWEAARARLGLGRSLARQGRIEEADATLMQAAEQFRAIDHATGHARSLLLRAELAMERDNRADAQQMLTEALAELEDRPAHAAVACNLLARLAIDTNNIPAAEHFLRRAIGILEQLNLFGYIDQSLQLLAALRLLQGRREEALAQLREAVQHIERVRGSLQADRLRAAFLGSRAVVYERLIATLLDAEDASSVDEAFSVAEQSRSRALLDLMGGALDLPHGAGDSRLIEAMADLRARLNVMYSRVGEIQRGQGESGSAERVDDREEIHRLEHELQVIEARVAVQRSTGVASIFAPPASAVEVRSLLQPGTTLIEYFFADDELVAFVVNPSETTAFRRRHGLPSQSQATALIERLYFQVNRSLSALPGPKPRRDRTQSDLVAALADLHIALIAPMEPLLEEADRILIVPHGVLHAVPFHALHNGEAFMLERHEIRSVPSASVLSQLLQNSESKRQSQALLVGVSDTHAPMIEHEVKHLRGVIKDAQVLTGDAATFEKVVAAMANRTLIHLACHGRFSGSLPLSSGLKLSDRWLTVQDLYDLRLDGAVVTLSGCETGRAAVQHGDELVGLIRGFLAAGASALVLSQWRVADVETTKMMADLYFLWHNGHGDIVACLREVQRRHLSDNAHPAVWAPFFAIGDV